jgi:hypothetical protein
VEQVARTAKKDEGTLRRPGELQGQALRTAARVVAKYCVHDVGGTLRGLVAHWRTDLGVKLATNICILASETDRPVDCSTN